jgi:hypothetical protein
MAPQSKILTRIGGKKKACEEPTTSSSRPVKKASGRQPRDSKLRSTASLGSRRDGPVGFSPDLKALKAELVELKQKYQDIMQTNVRPWQKIEITKSIDLALYKTE